MAGCLGCLGGCLDQPISEVLDPKVCLITSSCSNDKGFVGAEAVTGEEEVFAIASSVSPDIF